MFETLLIFLLPVFHCLSSSSTCYNFVCQEQTTNKTGCILQDGANYYLEPCKSDWYCADLSDETNFGKCILKD